MQNVDRTLKFEIDKGDKAVLILKSESGKDTTCLIDTGANVPIWFMGESFPRTQNPELKEWLNHAVCRRYFVPNFRFCTNFVPNRSRFIKIYVKYTLGKTDSGGCFLHKVVELA